MKRRLEEEMKKAEGDSVKAVAPVVSEEKPIAENKEKKKRSKKGE